jgi:hypothetical protein
MNDISNFYLRWHDFEANIRHYRDLRIYDGYLYITLATDDTVILFQKMNHRKDKVGSS